MTDRAISEAAMLDSLRDIQLPATAAGGAIADIAVTVGLAGLAALILAGVLRLLSIRATAAPPPVLRDELARLADLDAADRRVALLHLLRRRAPDRFAALKGRLYQPGDPIALAELEAEVAHLA